MAVFKPSSESTKVPAGQSLSFNSSRLTTSPLRSTSRSKTSRGWSGEAHPAAVPPHFAGAGIHFEAVRTAAYDGFAHWLPSDSESCSKLRPEEFPLAQT